MHFLRKKGTMSLQEGSRKVQKKLGSFIGIYRNKFYSITDSIRLVVAQYFLTRSFEEIKSGISFNRILDDHARLAYQPVVEQMNVFLPHMMARKIPKANVQQSFCSGFCV